MTHYIGGIMSTKETFGARLKKLRLKSQYDSQDSLSEAVGIARQTLGNYENDSRKPDSEIIIRLSRTLGVSADYLLGLTEVETPSQTIQAIHKTTGLSEEAIMHLHIDYSMGEGYFSLLSAIISNHLLPQLISILENYMSADEYLSGCAETFISELTCYDSNIDSSFTRKAIIKKVAEEYFWKIVDECSVKGDGDGTKGNP